MCYFIALGVPGSYSRHVEEAFGSAYRIIPTVNPVIGGMLPRGFAVRMVTNGHCSCGLYARPRTEAEDAAERQRLRKKLAKRGWSEAKISRSAAQARHNLISGLVPALVPRFQAACAGAGNIAVVVHWYHGEIDREQMTLVPGEPCRCSELPARAAALPEDEVLYVASEL